MVAGPDRESPKGVVGNADRIRPRATVTVQRASRPRRRELRLLVLAAFAVFELAVAVLAALAYVHVRRGATSPTARDVDGVSAMFVFVKIPESIMPIERGKKYEDPIDAAMTRASLGSVSGGGTQMGEGNTI